MSIAIERTRAGRSPTGQRADSPETGTGRAPARTLTPDSEPPCCVLGELEYTGRADLYACMDCGTTYHVPVAEHEKTCRFGCGRRTMECSYYGPPCEERVRIHQVHFGERTPVLDEERREDEWAATRREYRED